MNYRFLPNRLPFILFHPEKAWRKIASENITAKELRNQFIFPLTLVTAIAAFIGSCFFINTNLPVTYSILAFIKCILLFLFVVYASAITHREITYALDLGRSYEVSYKIVAYSIIPLFICYLASHLFESLVFVNILAVYGLYLFRAGSDELLNPPEYKKMPMLIAMTVVVTFYFVAAAVVLNQLTDRLLYAFLD